MGKRTKDQMAADVAIAMSSELSDTAKSVVARNVIWQWSKHNLKCKWVCPTVSTEVLQRTGNTDLGAKAARKSLNVTFDHVVPIKVLITELLKAKDNPATQRTLLDEYAIGCLITKEQNKLLNQRKLRQKMPAGWGTGDNAFARYVEVGIETTTR